MGYNNDLKDVRRELIMSSIDGLQDEIDNQVNHLCDLFKNTYDADGLEERKSKTDEWLLKSTEIMFNIAAAKKLIRTLETSI